MRILWKFSLFGILVISIIPAMFSHCLGPGKIPDCPSLISLFCSVAGAWVATSRLLPRETATEQNREIREGQSGLFPGSKQCENMAGIIGITKIPKRLNFQRIRVAWVIFLKAYELWVKFQGTLKLWVKFQNLRRWNSIIGIIYGYMWHLSVLLSYLEIFTSHWIEWRPTLRQEILIIDITIHILIIDITICQLINIWHSYHNNI